MTSTVDQRQHHDHAAVRARPQHRRRGAGRAGGDRRGRAPAARRHADAAVVPQGQPGRLADPLPRADLARRCRCRRWTSTPRTMLAQRISTINGVAQVQVYGSQKYAVRVQLDPNALAARGIGIDEVAAGGRQRQREPADRHAVRARPRVHGPGQRPAARRRRLPPLIVAYRNGAPVRLDELGRVIDSVENDKVAAWYNDTRAIVLGDPAPARHQHRRGGGRDHASCCRRSSAAAGRRSSSTCCYDRSAVDPRIGATT